MQPDDDRIDSVVYTAGVQNVGWSGTTVMYSDNLRTADYNLELNNLEVVAPADSHTIATTGYSNFPGYIENYSGDEDSGLEAVVPDLIRKTLAQAQAAVDAANLDLFSTEHFIQIDSIVSDGTTVRVYAWDTDPWDNDLALVGLRINDKVYIDTPLHNFPQAVTITALNADGTSSWIEFETATDLGLDSDTTGNIWAGPDLTNVVTLMRWVEPGDIRDEGYNVHVRYLSA
jgi:hypothetical protein